MVHVIVTMQVAPGKMPQFMDTVRALQPYVLREPGCLAYDFTREVPSPLGIQEPIDDHRVTLIERWESMSALAVHAQPGTGSDDPERKRLSEAMRALRTAVVARVCTTE